MTIRVVFLLSLCGLISCGQKMTPETFLFPKDFKGIVFVIYDQNNGTPEKLENGRRVYEIPTNGILFTKFKQETGYMDQQYYFVTETGQRQAIKVLDTRDFNEEHTLKKNPQEPDRNIVAVFNPGINGRMTSSDNKTVYLFQSLKVGTYNDLQKIPDITTEYIDSLARTK